MRVAITGSRHGLSDGQRARLIDLICEAPISEFHYGDCKGVDEEAFWLCVELGSGGVMHAHPATLNPKWDAQWRAHTTDHSDMVGIITHEPKHPLARNQDMVDAADIVWAFPENDSGTGGTWFTINYARARGVPVEVALP